MEDYYIDGEFNTLQNAIYDGVDVNEKNSYKATALHFAVLVDDIDAVQLLLDHGALVNIHNENNRTPLTLACMSGNIKIIKLLLSCGANPYISDKVKWECFMYSTKEIRKLLKSY